MSKLSLPSSLLKPLPFVMLLQTLVKSLFPLSYQTLLINRTPVFLHFWKEKHQLEGFLFLSIYFGPAIEKKTKDNMGKPF